jgi:hypothetical protein
MQTLFIRGQLVCTSKGPISRDEVVPMLPPITPLLGALLLTTFGYDILYTNPCVWWSDKGGWQKHSLVFWFKALFLSPSMDQLQHDCPWIEILLFFKIRSSSSYVATSLDYFKVELLLVYSSILIPISSNVIPISSNFIPMSIPVLFLVFHKA